MRDVAAEAGVATETLYAHFPSKRALLQGVVDVAVVGDDEPLAVADRPEFAAMGRGSLRERTAAAASCRPLCTIGPRPWRRSSGKQPATMRRWPRSCRRLGERQRTDVAASIALILGRGATPVERDGVWAVTSPEVYCLLVDESGWTPQQYEQWMSGGLERLLRPDRKRSEGKRTER